VQAINYFVAQKYIEAFKALAEAPNQKFVMMPMESSGVIGSLGGIAELAKEAHGTPAEWQGHRQQQRPGA
jgi:regulator of protease activity HflC (stomatin/prohibitin superfamily)